MTTGAEGTTTVADEQNTLCGPTAGRTVSRSTTARTAWAMVHSGILEDGFVARGSTVDEGFDSREVPSASSTMSCTQTASMQFGTRIQVSLIGTVDTVLRAIRAHVRHPFGCGWDGCRCLSWCGSDGHGSDRLLVALQEEEEAGLPLTLRWGAPQRSPHLGYTFLATRPGTRHAVRRPSSQVRQAAVSSWSQAVEHRDQQDRNGYALAEELLREHVDPR